MRLRVSVIIVKGSIHCGALRCCWIVRRMVVAINPEIAHGLMSKTHESTCDNRWNPGAGRLLRGIEVTWRFAANVPVEQLRHIP